MIFNSFDPTSKFSYDETIIFISTEKVKRIRIRWSDSELIVKKIFRFKFSIS